MLWKRGWRPVNLIDTNVILRYLLGEITDYPGIRELFERLKKDAELVECLIIVFFQVIFVMRSFYKIGREKIIAIVEKLLRCPGFYARHKPIILLTLDTWRQHGSDVVDAHLAALAESGENRKIYSLDRGIDRMTRHRIKP